MWAFLIFGSFGVALGLTVYAGHVAVAAPSEKRRADAFRVLNLVWRPILIITAATAAGAGATSGLTKLIQAGLF